MLGCLSRGLNEGKRNIGSGNAYGPESSVILKPGAALGAVTMPLSLEVALAVLNTLRRTDSEGAVYLPCARTLIARTMLVLLMGLAASASGWAAEGVVAGVSSSQDQTPQGSLPADAELLRSFSTHRQAFDRLRQMVAEDVNRQGPIFSEDSLSDSLPPPRSREYRSLLASIHRGLIVTFDYGGIIRFIFISDSASAVGPGSLKGIEFVPSGARSGGTVVKSLDDVRPLGEGIYLRRMEGSWYLLYQKTL
jgi:hypothetical protein